MKTQGARSRFSWFIARVAACGLMMANGGGASAEYFTMEDIRAQAQGGWHEQLQYKDHVVEIDIDFILPEVETVPVLSVQAFNAELQDWNPEMDIVYEKDEGGGYVMYTREDTSRWLGNTNEGGSFRLDYHPDVDAENNALSYAEALDNAREIIDQYNQRYGLDLRFSSSIVYSVAYRHEDWETQTYWDPKSEAGHYEFCFRQYLHGIPWLQNYIPLSLPNPRRGERLTSHPLGNIDISLFDRDVYWLLMEPAVEIEVLEEDIPLASVEKVKQTFSRVIQQGYIRSVNGVRFGYVLMHDPQERTDRMALFPVWILDGIIVENPDKPGPLPEYTEDELALLRQFGGDQKAVVNAQTGEYFDPLDGRRDRDVAKWIKWSDAR